MAVKDSLDDFQIELYELQADMDTKRWYSKNIFMDFCKLYVCGKFSNLSRHARKIMSLFDNTYCIGHLFYKMKLTKTRCRSPLTDEDLTNQQRVATTSVNADIDKLCKDIKFQVSH